MKSIERTCVIWLLLLLVHPASSGHSSNWAVLVCTSRDWRNYRHVANVLGLYRDIKRLGISDDRILLMMGEDVACNARNAFPASVFYSTGHEVDLYESDVQVDYRGSEVTVENFIRLLTGRHSHDTPRSRRLLSDAESNVLIYLTGHGGDEFMRFQGQENLVTKDMADAFIEMYERGRYKEILLIVDTCEASTLYSRIRSPNVVFIGSSSKGESSYAFKTDPTVGVSLIDRFTLATLKFLQDMNVDSKATLKDLIDSYNPRYLESTLHYSSTALQRDKQEILLMDFFGHVKHIQTMKQSIRLKKRMTKTAT